MKCQVCGKALKQSNTKFKKEIGNYKIILDGVTQYICSSCKNITYDNKDWDLFISIFKFASEKINKE